MKQQDIKYSDMFTIDLLKGHGIPLRNGLGGVIILLISAIVPAAIAISLYSLYLHNDVITRMKRQEVVELENKTAGLADAIKIQKTLEKKEIFYKACLSEVKTSIANFNQWSGVLTTIVDEMPSSVILTRLAVEQDSIEKEVPKNDDPKKKVKIFVPVTKLVLKVNTQGQEDRGEEMKNFKDSLYASSVLGPKLQSVVSSQKSEKLDGKETVSYEIKCTFKTE